MNAIFNRTSIRKYKDLKVEDEKIELLLKAAMQAPSAGNQQPWEFVVVEDKTVIEKLSHAHQYASFIKDAPLVIVPVYRKEGLVFPEYTYIDMSNACENLWLEATDLGLGCVWLGISPLKDREAYVNKAIQLDKHLCAFSLMAIGYPKEDTKATDRFDENRIHYIK